MNGNDKDLIERVVWPYRLMVPILYLVGSYVQFKKFLYRIFGGRGCVPKTNFWLFDGVSINGRRVKDGAATWKALDPVYNFRTGEGKTRVHRLLDNWWVGGIRNAQAVRNRLMIVESELAEAIRKIAVTKMNGESVQILSLAAGSGQGVIEVIANLRQSGIRCQVLLVDQDVSALAHARSLAKQYGVSHMVTTREGNALSFYRDLNGLRPDIIEMCGLMDYLEDKLAVALIKKIHRYLQPDGFFLTCHIHPNAESYFLQHVVNWGMLYRTRRQLRELLVDGGFLETKLHTEFHRIHSVAVAQKL